ncbi:hypothetical protein HAX54_048981 [Datura stramonium]|uniref:SCP domain-containing protein n=1 Tax=Datura stramonium TaxID=4076 RepID=A0ABS8WNR4_DATST|nr:hypothetical protein [Datura stramonium]
MPLYGRELLFPLNGWMNNWLAEFESYVTGGWGDDAVPSYVNCPEKSDDLCLQQSPYKGKQHWKCIVRQSDLPSPPHNAHLFAFRLAHSSNFKLKITTRTRGKTLPREAATLRGGGRAAVGGGEALTTTMLPTNVLVKTVRTLYSSSVMRLGPSKLWSGSLQQWVVPYFTLSEAPQNSPQDYLAVHNDASCSSWGRAYVLGCRLGIPSTKLCQLKNWRLQLNSFSGPGRTLPRAGRLHSEGGCAVGCRRSLTTTMLPTNASGKQCGHYTQVVWRTSLTRLWSAQAATTGWASHFATTISEKNHAF